MCRRVHGAGQIQAQAQSQSGARCAMAVSGRVLLWLLLVLCLTLALSLMVEHATVFLSKHGPPSFYFARTHDMAVGSGGGASSSVQFGGGGGGVGVSVCVPVYNLCRRLHHPYPSSSPSPEPGSGSFLRSSLNSSFGVSPPPPYPYPYPHAYSSTWARARVSSAFHLFVWEVDYSYLSGTLQMLMWLDTTIPNPSAQGHHAQEYPDALAALVNGKPYPAAPDQQKHTRTLTCVLTYTPTVPTRCVVHQHIHHNRTQHTYQNPNTPPPSAFYPNRTASAHTSPCIDDIIQSSHPHPGAGSGFRSRFSGGPVHSAPAVYDPQRSRFVTCSLPLPAHLTPHYTLRLVYTVVGNGTMSEPDWSADPDPYRGNEVMADPGMPLPDMDHVSRDRAPFQSFELVLPLCETLKHKHQFGMCYARSGDEPDSTPPSEIISWMQYHRLLGATQTYMYDRYGTTYPAFMPYLNDGTVRVEPDTGAEYVRHVTWFPVPHGLRRSEGRYYHQVLVIEMCRLQQLHTVDWLLQMDPDEFIVLHDQHHTEQQPYAPYTPKHPQLNSNPKPPNTATPAHTHTATPSYASQRTVPASTFPQHSHSHSYSPVDLGNLSLITSRIDAWHSAPIIPKCIGRDNDMSCETALSYVVREYSVYGALYLWRFSVGSIPLLPRPVRVKAVGDVLDVPLDGLEASVSVVYRYMLRVDGCGNDCEPAKYMFRPVGWVRGVVHHLTHTLGVAGLTVRVHHFVDQAQDRPEYGPVYKHRTHPSRWKSLVNDTSAMRIQNIAQQIVNKQTLTLTKQHIRQHNT